MGPASVSKKRRLRRGVGLNELIEELAARGGAAQTVNDLQGAGIDGGAEAHARQVAAARAAGVWPRPAPAAGGFRCPSLRPIAMAAAAGGANDLEQLGASERGEVGEAATRQGTNVALLEPEVPTLTAVFAGDQCVIAASDEWPARRRNLPGIELGIAMRPVEPALLHPLRMRLFRD